MVTCWVKRKPDLKKKFFFLSFCFFPAFCIYKPQICCWKLDHFLPACEIRQSSRVKPGSAGGAGTVLTLPLAPVGGHQHCWLNKQGRCPVQTTASGGDWNKSATCNTSSQFVLKTNLIKACRNNNANYYFQHLIGFCFISLSSDALL